MAQRSAYTVLSDPAAFERVLKAAPVARSRLFALHRASAEPLSAQGAAIRRPDAPEHENLSTSTGQPRPSPVDNQAERARPAVAAAGLRVGLVVPKRWAARAVTRNLVKRRARLAVQAAAPTLAQGDWVLRLRAPLPRKTFTSAASSALVCLVVAELEALFATLHRQGLRAARHQPSAPDAIVKP